MQDDELTPLSPKKPEVGIEMLPFDLSIPPERKASYNELFDMYDLDGSGLIDDVEEIRGLMMNTWFKIMAGSEVVAGGDSGSIVSAHTEELIHAIEAGTTFTPDQWAEWFEDNVFQQYRNGSVKPSTASEGGTVLALKEDCEPSGMELPSMGIPTMQSPTSRKPAPIPPDRRKLYDHQFSMYDLSGSGLIDSPDEARGLVMNLWIKTLAEHASGESEAIVNNHIESLVAQLERGKTFNPNQFAEWFEVNVYQPHATGAGNVTQVETNPLAGDNNIEI